jgi:hypothetical protein
MSRSKPRVALIDVWGVCAAGMTKLAWSPRDLSGIATPGVDSIIDTGAARRSLAGSRLAESRRMNSSTMTSRSFIWRIESRC